MPASGAMIKRRTSEASIVNTQLKRVCPFIIKISFSRRD
jgi:hypothetical protein